MVANDLFKRREDGGPDELYWEEADEIFDSTKDELNKNYKKFVEGENLTTKSMTNLILQVTQFQEDHLKIGEESEHTRIPAKHFYKPETLAHILGVVFKFRTENNWRKIDFTSSSSGRLEKHFELIDAVWEVLYQEGYENKKKVFLSDEIKDATQETITAIIEKRGGEIVGKEDEASHILYGPSPKNATSDEISANMCPCCALPMESKGWNNNNKTNHINQCRSKKFDSGDLLRLVASDNGMILLHTVGKPSSWDTWVHEEYLTNFEPEDYREEGEPLHVSVSWVTESDAHNEWLDEEDYVVPYCKDDGSTKNVPRKLLLKDVIVGAESSAAVDDDKSKRRRSPSPSNDKKKKMKTKTKKKEIDPTKDLPDPIPETIIEKVESPGSIAPIKGAVYAEIGKSAPPVTGEDMPEDTVDVLVKERDRDIAKNDLMRRVPLHNDVQDQAHHIIVPSYSAWFDNNSIHAIEKRALPEYFNTKNKSKTPEIFLGYRNFMLDTYRLNPTEYLTVTAARRNLAGDVCAIVRVHAFLEQWGLINYQVDLEGRPSPMGPPSTSHFHVMADAPSGLHPVTIPYTKHRQAASLHISDLDKGSEVKHEGVQVKTEGDLSAVSQKIDAYVKKEVKPWTDQETLLLLEALDMFRDDWNNVAEHVGTRTQDECIMHFLKLPIEDPFMEAQTGKVLEKGEDKTDEETGLGPIAYQPIPFSQSGNPVMSTVAFLASVVDPRVAAAAAKAALQEFSHMKNEIPTECINTHLNQQAKKEEEKKEAAEVQENGTDAEKKETKEEPMDTEEAPGTPTSPTPKSGEATVTSTTVDSHLPKTAAQARPPTDGNIQTAAASALAAAAVKAKHLAAVEERKIKSLVALLVETQMKKLEIKLRHFEELEATMDAERQALELQRQQLIQERQAFYKELVKVNHGGVVNFPSPPAAEPVQSVPVSTPGTPVTSTTGAPPHYAPQHHYVGPPPPGGVQMGMQPQHHGPPHHGPPGHFQPTHGGPLPHGGPQGPPHGAPPPFYNQPHPGGPDQGAAARPQGMPFNTTDASRQPFMGTNPAEQQSDQPIKTE